jgi:tetratricopeptide (TPR) repeat protein
MERVNAFRSTARHLILEGARLEDAGRIDESITRHLQALEADPAAAQAHVNLISLYGRKGEHDAAQRFIRRVKLQGDHAGAHSNWGVLLGARGARRSRRCVPSRLVNPFHPQAHNNLRHCSLPGCCGGGSITRRATARHRLARFNLGRVLVALGRPQEAAEHFERLLVPENKDTPRFTYALATAWLAAGDIAKGRKYSEQALETARRLGETGLAAKIELDLKRMKQP